MFRWRIVFFLPAQGKIFLRWESQEKRRRGGQPAWGEGEERGAEKGSQLYYDVKRLVSILIIIMKIDNLQ